MINRERKTLNLIRKKFSLDEVIFLDCDKHVFRCDGIEVPYRYEDMPHIIRSLSESGLLLLSDNPCDTYFSITYDGCYLRQQMLDNLRIAFLTKWIPGFISGVATTLVVELLLRYLL